MSAQRRRALVTGSTGFIGTHLVTRLLSEGWEVEIIVRPRTFGSGLGPLVPVHEYDGHVESLINAVGEARPDVVFHVASMFLSTHTPSQIEPMIASNILFGTHLLEAMRVHDVNSLVNVGSYWQHYQNRDYDPVCLYAATKQAFESILQYFSNAGKLNAVTLKLFDTYGPNDPRPKLLQFLHTALLEGKRLQMSPGEQSLSLVYIDDVMRAFMVAADRLLTGKSSGSEVYTVSADQHIRIRELVGVFSKVAGRNIEVEWGAQPYRPRQMMAPCTVGVRLPGWKPKVSLKEGLRRMVQGSEPSRKTAETSNSNARSYASPALMMVR
jgi:nucleoside-diphosphate-sugar epimerase